MEIRPTPWLTVISTRSAAQIDDRPANPRVDADLQERPGTQLQVPIGRSAKHVGGREDLLQLQRSLALGDPELLIDPATRDHPDSPFY